MHGENWGSEYYLRHKNCYWKMMFCSPVREGERLSDGEEFRQAAWQSTHVPGVTLTCQGQLKHINKNHIEK